MAEKNDYTGFPGKCSGEQLQALEEFRQIVIRMKLYKAVTDQINTPQGQIGDEFLLRFLRARKFDVKKTKEMFDNFIQWRQQNHVDKVQTDFVFNELPEVRNFYPHGYYHHDKLGRPVYIERIGLLKLQQLFQITTEERLIRYYIQSYETLLNKIFPACSKAVGRRVDQTLTILDLKGSTMKMMSKQVYNFIKLASTVAQDNYPEILGKMFIINAPMLFSGVWAVIKPWLDEKTRNKIVIIGSGFKEKLNEFIDDDKLPDFLGGNCKDSLDSNIGPWNPYGKSPIFPGEKGYVDEQQLKEQQKLDKDKKELEEKLQKQVEEQAQQAKFFENDDEQQQDEDEDEEEEQDYESLKLALQGLNIGQSGGGAQHQKNQKYELNTQGQQIPMSSDTPLNTQIDADEEN